MDIREMFGLNMRRYRKATGTSQEALAVRMGVDRAHVSSMERGQQNVTLTTLWHASHALGVKPAALLDDSVAAAAASLVGKVPRKPRTKPSG
jgi:transcriptional regulator with XRE-family HTH domain